MKTKLLVSAISLATLTSVRPGDGTPELEIAYDSADDIPAGFEGLYSEREGKHVLTKVKGLKTDADVNRLRTALDKERADHKNVRTTLNTLAAHGSIEDILANLDRIPELEAKQGKGDPADIEKIVAARLSPLQRQLKTLEEQNAEKDNLITGYKGKEMKGTIRDVVSKAATNLKVRASAIEDAVVYAERVMTIDESGNVVTKEGVTGTAPFMDPESWLRELLPARTHWLEDSLGGGAGGSKGGQSFADNPYSHDNWSITKQMALYKENPDKARKMAAVHGVDVLNPKQPAKKA